MIDSSPNDPLLALWPRHSTDAPMHWHVLCTDWSAGATVLQLWQRWRTSAARPQRLFVTAIMSTAYAAALSAQHTKAGDTDAHNQLPAALRAQLYGLLPGLHRIELEAGQVFVQLWVGDWLAVVRQLQDTVDAIGLHAPTLDVHTSKALARLCRRGSALVAPAGDPGICGLLHSSGFVNTTTLHAANAADTVNTAHVPRRGIHAVFDPAWTPKTRATALPVPHAQPGTALMVGAGLAGAALARSLAVRGWQVTVLGRGPTPADGASGLPAGLFCPHVSPDDSVLSRLSRAGVRQTLQRLQQLAPAGGFWAHSGVLHHDPGTPAQCPPSWPAAAAATWAAPASADQLAHAQLPLDTSALWHTQAGWVEPAAWVAAQLAHPNIQFLGNCDVAQLQPNVRHAQADPISPTGWQALDAQGQHLAEADIAIVAAGPASQALLQASTPKAQPWSLQAIRGQVTHGAGSPSMVGSDRVGPPFPVNGNGNWVAWPDGATSAAPAAPMRWIMGSTFERDVAVLPPDAAARAQAHATNWAKLRCLLPSTAAAMQAFFDPDDARCQPTWSQVRCASGDRLPIAGPVTTAAAPGLWVLTALGARGLTLSVLCAELLAARLHGEPLPLEPKLAQHLGTERWGVETR